jgi:hypothetical protein
MKILLAFSILMNASKIYFVAKIRALLGLITALWFM